MPRVKYRGLIDRLRGSDLFTFKLLEAEVGRGYAKLLLHKLRGRGEVVELVKGVYSFKKSPYMLVKAIPLSYIGLGSAAFLHGMWEQVPSLTVLSPMVPRVAKGGIRFIAGSKVILRRISEDMFFGYEHMYIEEVGGWVRVSDPEKTLIDMAYFGHPLLEEMLGRAEVDESKLRAYLEVVEERRPRGWRKILEAFKHGVPRIG